jgi:hypothetical protein
MQFWFQVLLGDDRTGHDQHTVETINIPSTPVLAECYLNQVTQQGSNGSAYIQITSYVDSGDPHNGNFQIIQGTAVTSVTFTLTASNTRAFGVGRILAIDE